MSWRRCGISFRRTARFLDEIVLPYTKILNLGHREYAKARELLDLLKPSDALHVAAMLSNEVRVIASEDGGFDRVEGIRRMWVISR